MSPALAGVLGAGTGLGVVLAVVGWRGMARPGPAVRVRLRARAERAGWRFGLAALGAVMVGVITGWPVGALLGAGAGWAAPSLWANRRAASRVVDRIEAVAGWAEMLRDTMAAAAGLEQAVTATASIAPLAIRTEVAALAVRLDSGERLASALRSFADDVADPTCDLVVAALLLAAEHQTQRLGELLGSLASAARDQATLRLRVEAGRARTRTSAKVVAATTAGMALGLVVLNRGYLAPYASAAGQLVLLVVGAIFAAAFVWLGRMTRPAAVGRFLTTTTLEATVGEQTAEARS